MGDFEAPRSRTFHIVQYEVNRRTGEKLFSCDRNIFWGLQFLTIEKYAYVLHDEDEYTKEEEKAWLSRLAEKGERPESWKTPVRAGEKKPRHWHIDLYCKKAVGVDKIAEWFGVPANQVQIPRGRAAFWDILEYLTHESPKQQAKGKHLYPDEAIHTNVADWREELNARKEKKAKERDMNAGEMLMREVLEGGLTLGEAQKKDVLSFMRHYDKLKKFRLAYLSTIDPPRTRMNYYLDGPGGVGKGLLSRAIARSLYPHLADDEKIFFCVGSKGAAFEGYDGQPVIIWNDRRASDLLNELNGRGNVFNVFDSHPVKFRQNIKYSSLVLSHEVNIINGIQPYYEFLDALAAEYEAYGEMVGAEDRSQSYRRFPFILRIREEDFDILLNRGFVDNTRNFEEYIEYQSTRLNLQRLQAECGANIQLARKIERSAVAPLAEKHKELLARDAAAPTAAEEAAILAKYANVGLPERIVIRHADGSVTPIAPVEEVSLFPKMLLLARLAA